MPDAAAIRARADAATALNALVAFDPRFEEDLGRQGLALSGWALAVKANIEVQGLPATAGTPALAGWVPSDDAPIVSRLRAAGASVLATANLHELALGATSVGSLHGSVANPHDPSRIAGGSSGGCGAAVAAGLVRAAVGTDTGGSCRIPAALCGCVGFRPTQGRYPRGGIVPLSATRDSAGLLARSVADVAALDRVIAPTPDPDVDVALPGLRLGVPRTPFYEDLAPDVASVIAARLDRLAEAGALLIEVDLSDAAIHNEACAMAIVLYESVRELAVYLAARRTGVDLEELIGGMVGRWERATLQAQLEEGAVSPSEHARALAVARPRLQRAFAGAFATYRLDAFVVPTTPLTAPPLSSEEQVLHNGRSVPTFATLIRNTDAASNAGLPCLTVPVGHDGAGLPVGLELVGPEGRDRSLLAIGEALHAALRPSIDPFHDITESLCR